MIIQQYLVIWYALFETSVVWIARVISFLLLLFRAWLPFTDNSTAFYSMLQANRTMRHSGQQKMWHIYLIPTFEKIVYCTIHEDVAIDFSFSSWNHKAIPFFLIPPLCVQYIFSTISCRTDWNIVAHILLHPFHRMTGWMCNSGILDVQLKKKGWIYVIKVYHTNVHRS